MVKNLMPRFFERCRVVTHGGVEKGQLLLVIAKVMGPRGGFDHADATILRDATQQRVIREKLIS